MKSRLFIALILFTNSLFGQTSDWVWAKSAGGTNSDIAKGVALDPSGNVFVGGQFSSADMSMGSNTLVNSNTGSNDLFISKYDPDGNVVWAKSEGGTDHDITNSVSADKWGNVYVAGYFSSPTITFGSNTLVNSGSSKDLFLVKYDGNGLVSWAASAAGSSSNDEITSVYADNIGNVYVTGYFESADITFGLNTLVNNGAAEQDLFVVKYNSDGAVVWARSVGDSQKVMSKSVSADVNGNVFIAGYFKSSSLTFGPDLLINNSSGSSDIFVAKYNTDGNVEWAYSTGGNGDDDINAIDTDDLGNVYVAGFFKSSTKTFGSTTLTNAGSPFGDFFLTKFDEQGSVSWVQTSTGSQSSDGIRSVSANPSGSIHTTGHFQSPTINIGQFSMTNSSSPDQKTYVASYDSTGVVQWVKSIENTNHDVGNSIVTMGSQTVYVVGQFSSALNVFGSTTLANTSTGQYDLFVAKIDEPAAIDEVSQAAIFLYPNPFNETTTLKFEDSFKVQSVLIHNTTGQLVKQINDLSGNQLRIDRNGLTDGMYFLTVKSETGATFSKKLLVGSPK